MTDVEKMLIVTRVVDAPPDVVWEAWTNPEMLAQWWWPARFQTVYEVDLRVGGKYRFRTADLPDLGVLALTGTYLEIRPPERLVYTWHWENGDEPPTQVSVDFIPLGNQTEIRISHQGFASEEKRENHLLGWTHCLDRLNTLLAVSPSDGESGS